jgi:hypothetical protein
MNDFWNENGLVNGKIPAGTVCPFYEVECYRAGDHCPIPGRLNVNDFSCGLARGESLIRGSDKEKK